ncbi:MAG: heme lyase CcmF/NrfE family subunit, partial [Candidatus Dormibacterales bacterium]
MLLADAGSGLLLAGLALALFAGVLSLWAGARGDGVLAWAGRRCVYAAAAAVVGASACLVAALLSHDFVIAYVAEHTDRETWTPLVAAAFYGGEEGSLLYWTLVLSVFGAASVAAARGVRQPLPAYAAGVLGLLLTFFLTVLVFVSNPFGVLSFVPADGVGLNPILRDGGMLVHPPFLLAGFSSFGVPFTFAMAALLAGRADAGWIRHTRRVALVAWGLQSVGLTLGMWWAYHVLGWGGYWGWDPVENVALLPWLATTAYLHSSQVQERRGMLKAWNFSLVILAFCLSIFGTFVVRSGVIQSVHSFAVSPIGPWFLGLLAASVAASGGALALRSGLLRSEARLDSPVSREGAFLLNNILLVGAVAAIFWGTVLPLVSAAVSGQQEVVGASFYEKAAGPIFLALFAVLAAGPLLPWRRAGRAWRRNLRYPALAAAGTLAALWVAGARQPAALAAGPVLAAALTTSLAEFVRGARYASRRPGPWPRAAARLLAGNRRRYGAYLAHVGIVLAAAGIAGSHIWQRTDAVYLRPGQAVTVAGYR